MIDPTSYLLISNNNSTNLNSFNNNGGAVNNINSFGDFEQSTSEASSGSPSQYGDPFVGGMSYFDQLTGVELATLPATPTSATRLPTLSTAMNQQQQQHNHHHHHHHHHLQHQHQHLHHTQHHHSHNQHSSLPATSSSFMLNMNSFSLDQLVDHSAVTDDISHDSPPMPYLDHAQLDHTDPSLLVDNCELNDDDDDDLIHGTLNSFVCTDLESESDNGYASGVSDGLFTSSSSLVDCSDSIATAADAYCFKQFSFSDLHYGLIDVGNSTPKQLAVSTEKQSVLMNLLIYGSDIGAGYTSIRS